MSLSPDLFGRDTAPYPPVRLYSSDVTHTRTHRGFWRDTRVPVAWRTPEPRSMAQSYLAKAAKHIRCPFIVDKESEREVAGMQMKFKSH